MPDRYHSLDFLRGLMMFLGILLHGLIPFMQTPVAFWPARDCERSPVADLFVFVIHSFRMQTFFFLAGFFGCLIYQRYGLAGMIARRCLRIALPFALGLLIIEPTLQAVWLMGNPDALRFVGMTVIADEEPLARLAHHFTTWEFLKYIYPFHLWFLYFLLVYLVAMIPLILIGRKLPSTRAGEIGDTAVRAILHWRGKNLLFACLTALLLWPMRLPGMADTPDGWKPPFYIFTYYFLFFTVGWQLWRHRDALLQFTQGWAKLLLIGNLLVLPAMLYLMFGEKKPLPGVSLLPKPLYHFATNFFAGLYTWLMIVGLMGAAQRFACNERHWIRYLADASYWCYLWHLTLVIALQIWLAPLPLPGLLKLAIVMSVSLSVLLVTYQCGVRYTLVGTVLNGKRRRI